MSEPDAAAIAREVHAMWHAGATREEGLERLRTRMSQGRYDELPGPLRLLFRPLLRRILNGIWGPEHCGPGHEVVICDAAREV